MGKMVMTAAFLAFAGCCSYCELKPSPDKTVVDGKSSVATYHVSNISYKLIGLLPISSGETWKSGEYLTENGRIDWFGDSCSLDDNLASVRCAAKRVGATEIRNVVGRYDTRWAWSCFLVKKTIVKTSCVLAK